MVGTAAQDRAPPASRMGPRQRPPVRLAHRPLEPPLGRQPGGDRLRELPIRHRRQARRLNHRVQACEQGRPILHIVCKGGRFPGAQHRRDERRSFVAQNGSAVGHGVRVAARHGALPPPHAARHEDRVYTRVAHEVVQARVRELRRMADALRGDGGRTFARSPALLRAPVVGHRDGEPECREDRVPERNLGIPGKGAHDAHAQARAGPRTLRPGEPREQPALERDRIGRAPAVLRRGAARTDDAVRAIAAVAAHEQAPAAEVDHREQAAVPAALAAPAAASRPETVELLAAGKAAAHGVLPFPGGGRAPAPAR